MKTMSIMVALVMASIAGVASDDVAKVTTNNVTTGAAGVTIFNTEPKAKQIELAKTDS